jgi:hypothetical protein
LRICLASSTSLDIAVDPPDPFQGERRLGKWSNGQAQQHEGAVVAGRTIEMELTASPAPMHDNPFATAAHGDGDGLHERSTFRSAIAGLVIEMLAPQTVRAVVAVSGPGGFDRNVGTAMTALERVGFGAPLDAAWVF